MTYVKEIGMLVEETFTVLDRYFNLNDYDEDTLEQIRAELSWIWLR